MRKGGALVRKVVDGHQCPRLLKHPMWLVLVVEIQWHQSCNVNALTIRNTCMLGKHMIACILRHRA